LYQRNIGNETRATFSTKKIAEKCLRCFYDGFSELPGASTAKSITTYMRPALFNAALGAECAIQKENIPAGQKNHNKTIMQVFAQCTRWEK
jgi:hypothetical protein